MLERYGWSDTLQDQFAPYAADGLVPARVLVQQRGLYEVVTETGELSAKLAGKLAREAEEGGYPVAGDWVAVAARENERSATIHHVLPRSSTFVRRASGTATRAQVVAANVDLALLVTSLNGDLNPRRIERYLATAWESGAEPVVVLTKADMCENADALRADVEAVAIGVPVHVISAVSGEGLAALRERLEPGKTAVLIGTSGVGKSTLVNALAGEALMATQAIREDDSRGRHTTTHRELVLLPAGALILDTPGMRELGLWDASSGVQATFTDVEEIAATCRFSDCRHRGEPGCAIRAAIEDGSLDSARFEAYGKLQREVAFEQRKDDPRARVETRKVWIQRQKNYRAMKRFREEE